MIHNLWTCKWQPLPPFTPFGASLLTGLCEWPFGFSIPMAVTQLVCNGAFVGRDGVRVHNSTLRGLPTVGCANINLRLLSSTQYPSRLRTRPTVVCQSDMITFASLLFLFCFADSSSFVFFYGDSSAIMLLCIYILGVLMSQIQLSITVSTFGMLPNSSKLLQGSIYIYKLSWSTS